MTTGYFPIICISNLYIPNASEVDVQLPPYDRQGSNCYHKNIKKILSPTVFKLQWLMFYPQKVHSVSVSWLLFLFCLYLSIVLRQYCRQMLLAKSWVDRRCCWLEENLVSANNCAEFKKLSAKWYFRIFPKCANFGEI